jgi:hypothetical protein
VNSRLLVTDTFRLPITPTALRPVTDVQEIMSGEFDELAATVAGVLVSALAGDSWEAAKQWFVAVVGHERRLAATRAELATASVGPDRDLVVQAQVRDWTLRLRDVLEDNPAAAPTLQDLVAGMRAQGLLKPPTRPSRGTVKGLIAAGIAVVVVAVAVIVSWHAGLFGGGASPQLRPLAWSGTEAPLPGHAAALTSDTVYDALDGISCPATGTCLAVGLLTPQDGSGWRLLVERLSNGTWTPEQTPPPLPAGADSAGSSWLNYIVCSSPSACTAVGGYSTSAAGGSTPNAGLVETLSGTTWTAASVPLPPGAGQDSQVILGSVACPTAGGCIAAGINEDLSSVGSVVSSQALITTEDGGTWTSAEAPLPPDAATTARNAELNFIACTGPGTCASRA